MDPGPAEAVREKPCVLQIVLPAAESVGLGLTVTVVEIEAVQELAPVTLTVYTPALGTTTGFTNGF